jgi:hypothetical protein
MGMIRTRALVATLRAAEVGRRPQGRDPRTNWAPFIRFCLTGAIAINRDRLEEFTPVAGEELKPALGKLWAMLLGSPLLGAAGALVAYWWWFEVELPGGRHASTVVGIAGLVMVPLSCLFVPVAAVSLASAKSLVIGETCVQLVSRGRVVIQIPYHNVGETYTTGGVGAGLVGLKLRDRADPTTRVPSWIKDRYEIAIFIYGKPLEYIHQAVNERLAESRTSSP